MAIGMRHIRRASATLVEGFASPVFTQFLGLCSIEVALIAALPGNSSDAIAWYFGQAPSTFDLDPRVLVGLIIALMVVDLLRTSLLSPLRRIIVGVEDLTPKEVAMDALSRVGPLFVVKQVVSAISTLVVLFCLLFGVAINLVPHVLVTFTLAPAIWAVTAMKRPIGFSLSQAPRISRKNMLAVFGVQSALLALGQWVGQSLSSIDASPYMGSYASWTMLVAYQFIAFFSLAALFLALEDNDQFEL